MRTSIVSRGFGSSKSHVWLNNDIKNCKNFLNKNFKYFYGYVNIFMASAETLFYDELSGQKFLSRKNLKWLKATQIFCSVLTHETMLIQGQYQETKLSYLSTWKESYPQAKAQGKVSIKVQRNSTRWSSHLSFCLMILTPGADVKNV